MCYIDLMEILMYLLLYLLYGYAAVAAIIFVAIFLFMPFAPKNFIQMIIGTLVLSVFWFYWAVVIFGERKQREEQRKMVGRE